VQELINRGGGERPHQKAPGRGGGQQQLEDELSVNLGLDSGGSNLVH
jgi:hypothetical protein